MTRHPERSRRRFPLVAAAAAVTLLSACGSTPPGRDDVVSGTGPMVLNTSSAADVVAAVTRAGLPAPNARNVSKDRCPAIRCVEALETDTITVAKFGATGPAQIYAGSTPGSFQVEDVVLSFAPSVGDAQKAAYEKAVRDTVA